jgi:hypothetical protein
VAPAPFLWRSVFDPHLGQANDRIERRAQLVAHARDELQLVLAYYLQLAVLVLDFVGTIGIVVAAALAASTDGPPPVATITAT